MPLTTAQKKLGVVVSWLVMVSWIVTFPLWIGGLIGDAATGYWWLIPVLSLLPLATLIQITGRMGPEEQALPGAPFITNVATIAVVIQMITQLNAGGITVESGWGQNIIIGLWVVGMLVFNWRNVLPIWARVSALIWGIVWFVDGFKHILGTAEGPIPKDFVTAYDSSVFLVGFAGMLVTVFAMQTAFRKSANS